MMSETGTPAGENPATDALTGGSKADLMEQAVELDPQSDPLEIKSDTYYLGEVYNTAHYGVFVQLTENWGSDISGLVHESELPPLTTARDYSPGDKMVVTLLEHKDDGDIALCGEYSPDVDATGVTLEDVREVIGSLQSELEATEDHVSELETKLDDVQSDSDEGEDTEPEGVTLTFSEGVTDSPVPTDVTDLAAIINELATGGYAVESITTDSRDSGSTVELNAIFEQSGSETGDTDES